ncbi:T9SS type A sorting domain-containing protein [Flavobacterium sp.]|uniref:Ig-like domain-containing protein n=1 Tax=Flavobacterium sp. TaxID=239 RepID=UPI002B4B4EE6|nr:PKD domain-containing protein [Flavobacterium sp.]HLP65578.1 PKD domain-containing protein [Flavobacterium sp.]
MKTTKLYIVVCLTFILTQFNAFAQYNGGNSHGSTANQLTNTSCSIPAHFYAYFGGNNDGSSVNELSTTSCGTAAFQFAYMGGNADGAATEELSTTACSIPPSFFAYMGGNNDGAGVETFEQNACAFPPQFYAYFGGNGDGFTMDKTAPICPTEPPVASFTASATEICVGQTVTFTDTSTNIPAGWTWTFEGGTPSSSTSQNPVITYNSPGTYDVTLVAANYNGTNTIIATDHITVYAYPVVTSTTPASRCDSGAVTLQATTNVGTVNWYDAATGGNLVGTGTSFTTPSLTSTTTYYVEALNGVCSSARSAVVATVNTTPTITSTTPTTRCGSGSATISATASAGTIFWYAAASGGTALSSGTNFSPNVTATTTYYVETTLNGCTSARTAVVVTVNNVPTITSTTPASRCDSGSVTLQATASNGTLSWYNTPTGGTSLGTGTSFTTPSISVSTNFYVESTDGTCTSTRTAVLATVNATPSITSTSPSQVCDSGTVTLGATTNAGTLNWYSSASGGSILGTGNSFTTPSISTTTTYYVEAVNGSCTSVRVPVIATVNTTPTITSTTDATVCGNVGATLSATASAGTIYWYTSLIGGSAFATGTSIPVSGASFTYYVEAISNGCVSTRVGVNYTNNPIPIITSVTPASRCDAGTVTLGATTDSGTVNWYDAPTGGNLVGTGTSFTTSILTSTTTYYVESSSASCTTVTRTAVTATVNEQPVITSTTPASRCGDGSVTLQATASIGTIYWYNAPTGGTLVATGGTFATPILGTTTTYYVEVVNGTCSSARTAVQATVYATAIITSTTPASRCDAGTLTLSATASNGTISWYDAPTGGNVVATGTSFTTPILSSTTAYYVEAQNGDCISSRTAVTASVNEQPVITSTVPASRCGDGSVTLQTTASIGTIYWYNAPTGGTLVATGGTFATPILGITTTYYVEVVNGTCSSARTAVVATVYAVSVITSTTPDSRCDAGILTLSATSNNGVISWYDAPNGGNLVATGTSFTTPILTSTTTYYVETQNGDCVSPRTAVTASIAPTAAPSGLVNQTYCDGETVDLIEVMGSNIVWYDASTGGNVIPAGTPIVSGVTYYASQTVTGCESISRLAVTMTLGSCLGNEEFIKNEIKLYPNPVIDVLNISSTESMSKIEVVNMLGQVVFVKTIDELETTVDMSRYSTGTYIIKVLVDTEVEIFKVIKK